MRLVICAMAKNEHLYINDWIKWYIKLGFDRIYLYDNDDLDKPFIKDYISEEYREKVEIIDIRGRFENRLQHKIYTEFYRDYGSLFDWCLFCDIDEFLVGIHDIHYFFSNPIYKYARQIRIMWKLFGDDDFITRDMSKPVYEVFKKPIYKSYAKNLIDRGNLERQGKAFVRGGMQDIVFKSAHFAIIKVREKVVPSILPSGKISCSKIAINEDYSREGIYLYHYMTKSLTEFINQKLKRTDAVFGEIKIDFNYYWRINRKTPQKIEFLKKLGLI